MLASVVILVFGAHLDNKYDHCQHDVENNAGADASDEEPALGVALMQTHVFRESEQWVCSDQDCALI